MVVVIKVLDQVIYKVKAVAHNDKRTMIVELGFLGGESYFESP